ncbi:hypothetical protein GDO78_008943 [Eleutherodactylus coqui]|uniref:Beta/gamma crystallin 'Greek key' domain-containing protein n=1 Tax=Eleutherodactylus coqui TaxID=57060 RepID=A0A8J6FG62_ELECQ|nr:hypothetical protein GDO78_008943 [Eleutherodactylus coqui]
MSTPRRRAGTWQDEVARSFSRLFSRTSSQEEESGKDPGEEQDRSLARLFFRSSSQEKKDGNDRTEPGEEQERSHSPSRLFFRRVTQGGTDNVNREEQDRSRSFSRLFIRTSSQEKVEENDSSRGAREDQSRVTPELTFNPPLQNLSEPEEEKDGESTSYSKVLDSEKQSRENFFHFIGNLFHFSSKSPLGNSKQGAEVPEPSKEHEDAQVKNNLDKEHLDQERTGDERSGAEEASEHNTAQQEQENPGVTAGGDPKDALEDCENTTADTPNQNAPEITYGTYRGSRRIRKLLKRRADVNSPIQEKEETPETCSVGDAPTENCLILHEWVKMEPVPDRNCQDEVPPSKIQIKMQSKFEPFDQNSKLHNGNSIIQKAKNSKLTNGPEIKAKIWPIGSSSGEADAEKSSGLVEEQPPNIEECVRVVPQPNAKESSETGQPNTGESLEDLQPTLGGILNISGHLEQNVENSEDHSKESTISENLEPNNKGHCTDVEPKTMDTSNTVWYIQPNSEEEPTQPKNLQPDLTQSVCSAETLQTSIDDDSRTEADPSPKVVENLNILHDAKENKKDYLTNSVPENADLSNSEKYGTNSVMSVMDNLHSDAEDSLVKAEEIKESTKENTKVPVDLENSLAANMQSASKQSHLEMALDSGSSSNNQQGVEVNLQVENKSHKDPSNPHSTTHNKSCRSSGKNGEDYDSPAYDGFKPEIERRSNIIDLPPNAQLVSSSSVDIEPKNVGNSSIGEQLQLHGGEYSTQPNQESNSTFLNKTLPESEDISNLHLQLKETSEDFQQTGNIEHLQKNASKIPESAEELLKAELPPNTKVAFHLKALNSTLLESTKSENISNLDVQPSEICRNSKDFKQIGNTEHLQTKTNLIPEEDLQNDQELIKSKLHPNAKVSFQLKELNNTVLEKPQSQSGDIPNLDLQLRETSRNSKDLKQIENIEHLQAIAETIPENDPRKAGELLQASPKVTFQLTESSEITGLIENQKPNLHIVSHVLDSLHVEEPSKVSSYLEPNSGSHVPEFGNDTLVHKVPQRHEFVSDKGLTETSHSNGLADEDNVHVDRPDRAANELDIKATIFYDNPDNITVPESCSNDTLSFTRDHKAVASRNISFDNGIECRSPSPITMSDSTTYVDCNDVQFESPNDSGIVSSQAYTPDEHVLFKTFSSEMLLKNIPDPFAVDQKNEEASVPDTAILKNMKPVINIDDVSVEESGSRVDGCTSNSGSDDYIKISTPDKLVNLNSDVYVAKVSMKTVNIEEVKISSYSLCSDIISVAKLESPTFTKELICIPNLSPPTDTENAFHVFHCLADDKDLWEKHLNNCYLETDELSSGKDNYETMNLVSDLPNNDSILEYTSTEKESPKITDKSTDVLIENLKNNNINVCSSDNIINVSLRADKSEGLMSSDSLKELRFGESLSELNPDLRMNHREKLSDLLLHSALLHDVTDTNEIISSCSTTAKMMILPGKDHSESSNELFEQKANEIIFSVLNSAIDELQNINQSHMIMAVHNHTLPDIKHMDNLSESHVDLEEHPAEVLGNPSDHRLIEDSDLIMTMAVGIVKDVISSSEQLVVSSMITNGLSKDVTMKEATRQKPLSDFHALFMDKCNDSVEETANSNHVVSSLVCDNVIHLPSCEINSNVLQVTAEVSRKVESKQAKKPKSSNESHSRVTEHMNENGLENNTTEDQEHLSFSRTSVNADTFNLIHSSSTNGDLRLDDMYCDGKIQSMSSGTEGSMEDVMYNNFVDESSNNTEFSDFFQFSIYNSRYVEISGSDDESTDEEKDSVREQASCNDSLYPVPSRRTRIYPYALSPIYEDDSACEDTLSNSSSPRYNRGATASHGGHDHTSILSLLQSVSDRLKEADLEEDRFSSPINEVSGVKDRCNKEELGELEDIVSPSKTSFEVPSTLDDDKPSLGARSGMFITKSFADSKPNLVSGRQSFLLNLTSHSNTYGAESGVESSSFPLSSIPSFRSETSVSPSVEPNRPQSMDLSPSTAAVNSLSAQPALPIQCSVIDQKPRASPKSVYYQYYSTAQNYLSNRESNEGPTQEKLEEAKKTAEIDMDPADSDSLKFNPRPGKLILSDLLDQENKTELKADVLDATSWVFPNGVNIRVIRGCWILYEKPHFEGQAHVLEEGEAVLQHLWDPSGDDANSDRITIGSVKRVVKDYFPEVVISSLEDTSDSPISIRTEVPSLENLVGKHPRSLGVNSGVWLAYTEPQYNGAVSVLEEGSELRQIQDSCLKSMRPLKMGGLKVQLPSDPRVIIYEKPHFQGWSRETTDHVGSILTLTRDGDDSGSQDIGSMRVIGGIWVGYENEKYKGYQYLLEEGNYEDWHAWGGYNNALQSIRYLQADFLESSVTLYATKEEDGQQITLFNQAVPDLELAGYNTRTRCIHVKNGMWVAYRQKHFCGEQYVLEKGRYKTHADWGGRDTTIMSIRPVLLEPLGRSDMKHLIKVYTSSEFQGEVMDITQSVSDCTSFRPMSFKVLRGCWLLCYEADSGDNLCVLEEGHFPDLASCGCPAAEIKSIRPIDYIFAEPSVSLFALDSCEGRELHFQEAVTSVLSKDLHFYAQSVWVRRGLWIAFEGANFLGRQMLLDPQQILSWSQFSGWKAIGSLRPLKQPSVYFMVKNRDKDKYLTVTGKLCDSRATFVSVSPRNGQSAQIWYFCRGFLKSKANDFCLDVIGGKNIPGSKVSLWPEHGKTRQKWKINRDGTIASHISDDLVLDLRGGNYYDQNYLVVNKVEEETASQKWDIEIL